MSLLRVLSLSVFLLSIVVLQLGCQTQPATGTGSVIFLHPDGTSAPNWAVARAVYYGPDGELEWDKLPHMALYRGHMRDSLTATSNGGATTHAYGVKVASDAFGMTAGGDRAQPIVDRQGQSRSVALQAIRKGIPTGVVQSGTSTEPGTACFLTSVPARKMHEEIAAQLIASGAKVMLGGGEKYFLPKGTQGKHGQGVRTDGRNLIQEAQAKGYTVVRTRDELLNLPDDTDMVLGLFAEYHTFNDKPEEVLQERGLPLYNPGTPTVAEMTQVALRILGKGGQQFCLIVEEEATDNFGNNQNTPGMVEALGRADEAIGVCRAYIAKHPRTLLVTAADSDAGGMRMVGIPQLPGHTTPEKLPERDRAGGPIDGIAGTGTAPLVAAPDQFGQRLPFYISWANHDDVSGGILVKAEGLNSHLVRGSMDNTEIPKLMRLTLFGQRELDD